MLKKIGVFIALHVVALGLTIALAAALTTPADAAGRLPNKAAPLGEGPLESFKGLFSSIGEDFNRVTKGTTATAVVFPRKYTPGSIIVRTDQRKLYFVTSRGHALRYAVGVGREGFTWSGTSRISRKAKWPTWTPPKEMRARQPGLPISMKGGPDNPLGARALYLGATLYRIHGTPSAASVGYARSSGCIRMLNKDVIDLYGRVKIGSKVYVYHKAKF